MHLSFGVSLLVLILCFCLVPSNLLQRVSLFAFREQRDSLRTQKISAASPASLPAGEMQREKRSLRVCYCGSERSRETQCSSAKGMSSAERRRASLLNATERRRASLLNATERRRASLLNATEIHRASLLRYSQAKANSYLLTPKQRGETQRKFLQNRVRHENNKY